VCYCFLQPNMSKKSLQTSSPTTHFKNPAAAAVKWLNSPDEEFIRTLVRDAYLVVRVLREAGVARKFVHLARKGQLPTGFWKAYRSLNRTLKEFIHAPQLDMSLFYEGFPVHWMLRTQSSIALHSAQVHCVLQLIEQGSLTDIRQCDHCAKWYKGRRYDQRFCSKHCKWNAFASDEKFKEERRIKERERYQLKKSGKVKQ
jgi:hypothetical protein